MKKALIVVVLVGFLFSISTELGVSASDQVPSTSELNSMLENLGVPSDVIDSLTFDAKLEIFLTVDPDAVFDGYTEEDVYLPDNESGEISMFTIPTSQLKLTVSGFKNSDGTYTIYPSFYWKVSTRVRNDSFGFALDSNRWTTVAGNVNMRLVMKNAFPSANPGLRDEVEYFDRASTSNFSGHVFKIPKNMGKTKHLSYEGHANFRAKPKGSGVDRKIILSYGDDTFDLLSGFFGASYSASIGVFSVSFPSGSTYFRSTSETLTW